MVYDLSMRSVLGGFKRYDSLREELLFLNASGNYFLLLLFCWNECSQKNKSSIRSLLATAIAKAPPTPSPTASSLPCDIL